MSSVSDFEKAVAAQHWTGRDGRSDQAVLHALITLNAHEGTIRATSQDIAELSGLSLRTVKTVLARLSVAGWVSRSLRNTSLSDGRKRQLPSLIRTHAPTPNVNVNGHTAALMLLSNANGHNWLGRWKERLAVNAIAWLAVDQDSKAPAVHIDDLAIAIGLTPKETARALDYLSTIGLVTRGAGASRVISLCVVSSATEFDLPEPLAAHDVFRNWYGLPRSYGVVLAAVVHTPGPTASLVKSTGVCASTIRAALACWIDAGWVDRDRRQYRAVSGLNAHQALTDWAAEVPELAITGTVERLKLHYRAERIRAFRRHLPPSERYAIDSSEDCYDDGTVPF